MINLRAEIWDAWNFLSLWNPRRLWNAVLITSSYFVAKWSKRPVHWGMPVSFSIEPTTSCNLRCPQCPSGLRAFTRPTGMLQGDLYQKIVDDLAPTTPYLTLYFQGEPYLNKEFLEMVKYAGSKRIYTATSTNAHYLDSENARKTIESGLNRIIISIDGTQQESYAHYRVGGKLDKVLAGTKNLVAWKRKLNSNSTLIIWQFIVFKHNYHEIPAIKNLAKEFGVDKLLIKTAQVYDYESGQDWIPDDPRYSRYVQYAAGYAIKNTLPNQCWRLWSSCVVTWDGVVVPCCFDKDADFKMGNLKKFDFRRIWRGPTYDQFRKSILKGRKEIEICKNCSEGCKIWS